MNRLALVFMVFVIVCGGSLIAGTTIYLEDGQSHLINNTANQYDRFFLDYETFNNPGTHVEITSNAIVSSINLFKNSTALISGGTVSGSLFLNDNSMAVVDGGTINFSLRALNASMMQIKGGTIGGQVVAGDSSIIYLYGSNFSVGGVNLNIGDSLRDYGIFEKGPNDIDYLKGTITGTLLDGSLIDNSFSIWSGTTADIVIVPEPISIALLGLGSLLIRTRKI